MPALRHAIRQRLPFLSTLHAACAVMLALACAAALALPALADDPVPDIAEPADTVPKPDIYAGMFDRDFAEPRFTGGLSQAQLDAALGLAGANRPELERSLAQYPQGSPRWYYTAFLIVNMPLSDLGSVKADFITQTVELAIQARAELPFPLYYHDEQWLLYVLPHRVSQEPIEDWRPFMHDALAPLIADCQTPQEAWAVVFKWSGEQATFKQTQRRDQGPLTTIKGGCGRCEELMTLQIDALRSVGLPARGVSVPWWSHSDNNHAWTEVLWPDGHWGLPGPSWEADSARQASVVVSMSYGNAGCVEPLNPSLYERQIWGGELLSWSAEAGACWYQFNSIANYRGPARLNLDLSGAIATEFLARDVKLPSPSHHVYIYVYNYGALRRVARVPLVRVATSSHVRPCSFISLGAGTYALSCDAPGVDGVRLATLTGMETRDVRWEDLPLLGADTVLVYPQSPPLEKAAP